MKALEKTKIFASNILTIYAFIALMFSGIAIAADNYHEKFLKVEVFNEAMAQQKIDTKAASLKEKIQTLNDEILDLKIERKYARKHSDKQRIDEKILRKQNQITNLKVQ